MWKSSAQGSALHKLKPRCRDNSPQVNWSDRRPPGYAFTSGSSNYKRLVIPGTPDQYGGIGAAWEHVIELANSLGKDAWINVPHAANDTYVRNLARLFRYGSDAAGMPYSQPQANPYHEPLRSDLRVWVEHSNEIWSNGGSFRQGDWAQQQATALGITKGAFNGRRAGEIWQIFNIAFAGEGQRVVKPAGAFTAVTSYTRDFLVSNRAADELTTTTTRPDTLAVTTYFGQPLVDWAFDNRLFLDTASFNDPTDATVNRAIDHLLNELVLAGTATGGERDAATGGFGLGNKQLAEEFNLPLVSYEGNSSMYTESAGWYLSNASDPPNAKIVNNSTPGATFTFSLANYVNASYPDDDTNSSNTDRLTKLVVAVNRNPRFAEVYRAHLNNAKSLGLYTHGVFVDVSSWGKYGQWGHKEYYNQPVGLAFGQAVKWQAILDFELEQRSLRELGVGSAPLNAAPVIPDTTQLDAIFTGQPYTRDLLGTAGDGTTQWSVLSGKLPAGLTFTRTSNASARITGTVSSDNLSGEYRFLVRAVDSDGDVDYAIYSLRVLRPSDPVSLAQFEVGGSVQSQTSFLDATLNVPGLTSVRIDNGPGLSNTTGVPGTLAYSGVTGATLADAVRNNDYLTITAVVETGKLVSFNGLDLRLYSQNNRTTTFSLRSDRTGTTNLANWTVTGTGMVSTEMNDVAALRDLAGTVEFRLYIHGSNGNQYESFGIGNGTGADATLRGSVRFQPVAPVLVSASSRKTHGSAGVFDLTLPLNGNGVDSRSGGSNGIFDIVMNFDRPVVTGSAVITSGTASIGAVSFSGSTMIVRLTGVTDRQRVVIAARGVSALGSLPLDTSLGFGFLIGDSTNDRFVTNADVSQVRSRVGQTTQVGNIRSDINADGLITNADVSQTRSRVGGALPASLVTSASFASSSFITFTTSDEKVPSLLSEILL